MKHLLFGLFLPLFSIGQTIHYEEDKIIYKGSVDLGLHSQEEVLSRLQLAVPAAAEKSTDTVTIQATDRMLAVTGEIKLKSPYHIKRTVHFLMELRPKAGGYDYKVDSVFVMEGRRGWKMNMKQAAELLNGLEETGKAEIETEVLLNEIDLRIQKLLVILESKMRTPDADLRKMQTQSAAGSITSSQ